MKIITVKHKQEAQGACIAHLIFNMYTYTSTLKIVICKLKERYLKQNVLKIINFLYVSQSQAKVAILDFRST